MLTLGSSPYQEQQLEYHIDRVNSVSYTRTWRGPKTYLDAIALAEKFYAESIELRSENNGVCTLVARYVNGTSSDGSGEVPTETHELDTAAVQQSIFMNENFQVLTAEEQLLVRKVFENQETRPDAITVLTAGVNPARLTLATNAYDLLVMGAESFENYGYVFTRTRKCSRRYSGKLETGNINKLWTTTQVADYTGTVLLFDVPSISVSSEETAKGLLARWRMSVCRVTDVSDGSRNMVEQWQLAKWSSYLYASY